MPYLIDGNNLCGAGRDRRLGMPTSEADLVRLLGRFATRRSIVVTVVCDGTATGRPSRAGAAGVRVLYSGAGRSADDRIVDLATRSAAPSDITLVTSDRELRDRVRDLGCRVLGCRRFAEIVRAGATPDEQEKPAVVDVAQWERYFAGED